jgi:hypothetical protein
MTQSRQSARLFLHSFELGTPAPPSHPQASVPHGGEGGGHTRLRETGSWDPNMWHMFSFRP